jgi:hypothetical protein
MRRAIGSKEETTKPVKRVKEIADLAQVTLKQSTLDPAAGRVTSATVPAGAFTPSGHYVSNTDTGVLGECVSCREEHDEAGTPDLVTLVPKSGGGGACAGCGRVFCAAHGATDGEGRFWCEACARGQKAKKVKEALARVVLGKVTGWLGTNDEKR